LFGTNTDWQGFAASMDEQAPGWDRKGVAVMLGAGGAARGVLHALSERGIAEIHVVNRTQARAEALVMQYPGSFAAGWDCLGALLPRAELLINTTSLGMHGAEMTAIDLALLPGDAIVADIV